MLLNELWRRCLRQSRTNRPARRRMKSPSSRSFKPRLEMLEDRITPSSFPTDSADWMAAVPNNTPLNQISIPGTHDTMTYAPIAQKTGLSPATALAATQESNFTVANQLDAGIRFLDIRTAEENVLGHGILELYHGPLPLNLTLNDNVFKPCINFLQNHPGETIILSIKADTEATGGDASAVPSLVQQYAENNSQYFYFDANNQVPTLGELRGKILVFRRYEASGISNPVGIDVSAWPNNTTQAIHLGQGGAYATIEDNYGISDDYFNQAVSDKWNDVSANIQRAAQQGTLLNPFLNNWYITFTSAAPSDTIQDAFAETPPLGSYSPFTYALGNGVSPYTINLHVFNLVNRLEAEQGVVHLGIIAMDYPDLRPYHPVNLLDSSTWSEYGLTPGLINSIVLSNFERPTLSVQTIAFHSLPNKTYGDADIALTATATSGLPVNFTAFNVSGSTLTPATNVSLYQDSAGNWFAHITAPGLVVIEASQPGGLDYFPAIPVSQSFTINPAEPKLTVSDGGVYNGNPFPATGTALGVDGKTPVSGNWSFTYYNGIYLPGISQGTPLSGPPTEVGTYTVIGNFTSSDPNYSNSSTGPIFFSIRNGSSSGTATFRISDGGTYNGNPFPASGTALGSDGTPISGSWSFTYYDGIYIPGISKGTQLPGPPTNAGLYSAIGFFTSNDPNYGSSQAPEIDFFIKPTAPTVTVSDGGTSNGQPMPATGTALGVDGKTPVSGSWSFTYYNGIYLPGISQGTPLLGPPTEAGTYTVIGNFTSSDPNYSGGTAQATFTINPATPSPTLTVSDGGNYNGDSFPAAGTALGSDGKPVSGTWSFTYYSGAYLLGFSPNTPLSGPPTNAGVYTVVGSFTSSDPNYSGGSAQATFTIKSASTTITAANVSIEYNANPQTVVLSAMVSSGSVAVNEGTVTFSVVGTSLTAQASVSNGSATARLTLPAGFPAGSYSLTASYTDRANANGVANFLPSPAPAAGTLTVVSAAPSPAAPPPAPFQPPTLQAPPLLAFFDSLLGAVETINANRTETLTDSIFGIPLLVSTFDSSGKLESVLLFGMNVTALFELL